MEWNVPIFFKDPGLAVFYVHVPKTGGTYVERLFQANEFRKLFWFGRPHLAGMKVAPQHWHREIWEQLLDVSKMEFAFATVRHPLDRLYSEYKHQGRSGYVPVPQWIDKVKRQFDLNPMCFDNHVRPQVDFLADGFEIYRMEDGLDKAWARTINRNHSLNMKKLEITRRNVAKADPPQLSKADREALIEFCKSFYETDLRELGYQVDDAHFLKIG